MTPKQADKLINSGQTVSVRNKIFRTPFTAIFVSRTRWNILAADGGLYDRGDLEIIELDESTDDSHRYPGPKVTTCKKYIAKRIG